MADIFLSYNRKDIELMQRLYNDLQAEGFTVWIDEAKLEPGTPSWQRAIEQAINESRCMIVILSPDAKQSKWVEIEASIAEESGRRIFPVLARGDARNAVLFRLRTYQWIDLQQDYQQQVKTKLLPALHKHLGKPPPITKPAEKTTAPPEKAMTASAPPSFLGFQWVAIPAGEFTMSEGAGGKTAFLPEYYIARGPVADDQYQKFVDAGHKIIFGSRASRPLPFEERKVALYEAKAFCKWVSQEMKMQVRLPTEAEWEKAMIQSDQLHLGFDSSLAGVSLRGEWTETEDGSFSCAKIRKDDTFGRCYKPFTANFRCVVVPMPR